MLHNTQKDLGKDIADFKLQCFTQMMFMCVVLFAVSLHLALAQCGRRGEMTWIHLTVQSMKHRIRSHSADDTNMIFRPHKQMHTSNSTHQSGCCLIPTAAIRQRGEAGFLFFL